MPGNQAERGKRSVWQGWSTPAFFPGKGDYTHLVTAPKPAAQCSRVRPIQEAMGLFYERGA